MACMAISGFIMRWASAFLIPIMKKFSANQADLLKKMALSQKEVKEISRDSIGNYWFIQREKASAGILFNPTEQSGSPRQ